MTAPGQRRIPLWIWTSTLLILGVAVGLLILGDRRKEPAEAFRFDVAKYQQVDAVQVLFAETAQIELELQHPKALAMDPEGRMCIAGENAVCVYDAAGSLASKFPIEGAPNCMAVAPNGDFLLGMRDHIERWTKEGARSASWESVGEKACLTSLAVDDENVYAADAGQRCILRFDHAGKLLGRLGARDEARGIKGFIIPSPYFDIAFDPLGALWAVNPGRHGLENFRPNGDLVSAWYKPSMTLEGFCGCCNPIHIAFRSDGTLITAEKGIFRIKMIAPDEKFLGLVAGPDAFGQRPDATMELDMEPPIKDIAVDAQNRVLALDARKNAIRIFAEKKAQP